MIVESVITAVLRRLGRSYIRMERLEHSVRPPEPDTDRVYMLYLHVPFCVVLCPFCSFHRVEFQEDRARRYFEALRREIDMFHEAGFRFGEIYVGGGTPTVMVDELARTLDAVTRVSPVRRISAETNPDDLLPERLQPLKAAGVNRLSVGVQSLQDPLLKEMQRYAKYGSSAMICERLAAVSGLFETLNVDMIFNLPHQSQDDLVRDLAVLTEDIGVDQISCYPLMGSSTTTRAMKKDMGAVSYEREKRLYYAILDHMDRAAYPASSAWCFSRKAGAIDEYIIDNEQYVGLGSGAMGYLNGQMTASSFSINRYLGLVESGFCGITRQVRYTPQDEIRYAFLMAFFGLRVEKAAMRERWGDRFERTLWKEFAAFRAAGAIRDEGDHWILTRRGMYLWVLMMRTFFIGVSNFRDLMRHGIKGELDPEDRAGLPAA